MKVVCKSILGPQTVTVRLDFQQRESPPDVLGVHPLNKVPLQLIQLIPGAVFGGESWAGYFTKHHSASHHQVLRPCYLQEEGSPGDLQGCLERLRSLLGKRPQGCGQLAPKVAQMPAIMPYAIAKGRRMPLPAAMPKRGH